MRGNSNSVSIPLSPESEIQINGIPQRKGMDGSTKAVWATFALIFGILAPSRLGYEYVKRNPDDEAALVISNTYLCISLVLWNLVAAYLIYSHCSNSSSPSNKVKQIDIAQQADNYGAIE